MLYTLFVKILLGRIYLHFTIALGILLFYFILVFSTEIGKTSKVDHLYNQRYGEFPKVNLNSEI